MPKQQKEPKVPDGAIFAPSLRWLASPAIVERGFDACNVAPGTRKRYLTHALVAARIALGDAACKGGAYQRWETERDALKAAATATRATREWTAKEERNRISAAEARGAIHARDAEMVAVMKAALRAQYCARMSGDVVKVDHGAWAGSPLETWLFLRLFEWASSRFDFATLKLARPGDTTDRETNYLTLGPTMCIVVNNWKCAGSHATGQRVLKPPAPLQRILKIYMAVTRKSCGDVLFVSARGGGPLSRDGMRKRVKNFFGNRFPVQFTEQELVEKLGAKGLPTDGDAPELLARLKEALGSRFPMKVITLTLLRKIFLSHDHGDALERMLDDAERHGHSLAQQHLYTKKRKRDA